MALRKTIKQKVCFGDLEIPVQIIMEVRSDVRMSITSSQAILRLPLNLTHEGEQQAIAWFHNALASELEKQPTLKNRFAVCSYANGQKVVTTAATYRLHLSFATRQSSSGRLHKDNLYLELNNKLEGLALQQTIRKLLSKLVSKHQLPAVQARVDMLNQIHFKFHFNKVQLREQKTQWGSCSSSGNIQLSNRLLLAPQPVLDYVIIHELAHLSEFNHSEKFWQLVAKAMPDYREKEQWLDTHGHSCTF